MGTRVMRLVAVVACLGFGAVTVAAQTAVNVAAGNGHSCAVTNAGTVWCWGANWAGQLGDGTNTVRLTPVPVSPKLPALDVTAVAAGDGHTCALTRAGAVWCWGDNRAGQLGDGTTTTRPAPVAVSGLGGRVVVALAASWGHTCAVTSAGAALCWGSNAYGQLGDGTTTDRLTPVVVTGLESGATAVAAGPAHTCAVTSAGAVWCWGSNADGRLGNGTTTDALTPVAVSYLGGVARVTAGHLHTCAVTSSGAVWCWGSGGAGQLGGGTWTDALTPVSVSGLGSGVAALTSGDAHSCALTSAGAVRCWGSGQLGDGLTGARSTPAAVSGLGSGVAAIGAAMHHTCAVTSTGAVSCWGRNNAGQLGDGTTTSQDAPVPVSSLASGVAAVAVGDWHTCAVTGAGAVKCWGWNEYGQVGDGTTAWRVTPVSVSGLESGVTSVCASDRHTCALTSGGAVWCWGNNWWGQLGDGTTTSRAAPVAVSGLGSGVVAVAAGYFHTCALTSAGAVWCWGSNGAGQVGDGTTADRLTPVPVSGFGSGATAIAAGNNHTCALTDAGAVLCWGGNNLGQLGDGTTTDRPTAGAVTGLGSGVAAVAATGGGHTCVLMNSGTVRCWGWNDWGQLGDGTTTNALTPVAVSDLGSSVAAVSAGWRHSCARTSAGAAYCWGMPWDGRLGDGGLVYGNLVPVAGLGSNVAKIAAGGSQTCAVTSGGALLCWGINISGLPGDDRPLIRLTPVMVSGFAGAAPTVSSVVPARGAAAGGTAVTITGTGFVNGATVLVGGVAVTNVVVVSATSITATTAPHAPGQAAVVVTNPDGQTAALSNAFTYVLGGVPVDFDGDGLSDVLWRHATRGEVWLWPMDGAARTAETYVRTVADTNWEVRGQGDQNGDGQADILWRHKMTGQVYFWPMNGSTPLAETYVATVDPAYDIVGTGDFDGDGKSDILWRNPTVGEVWVWLMNGATPLAEVYVDTVDPGYVVKGVGDVDADGKADIVWHGVAGDVWVWLMNGTARLSQTYVGTVADTTYQIQQVADFDGNGKADLLWWNSVQGDVWVWPMDGATRLSETYVGTVPDTNYRIQSAGDYDGDAKADILWRNIVQGDVWVWLMNGPTKLSETYVGTVPEIGYEIVKAIQAPAETHVVEGTVRDDGNLNLLSRVTVRLIADTGSSEIQTAFEGGFSFASVSGPATLTATAAGYEGQSLVIRPAAPGAPVRLDLRLRRLAGRAVPCGDAPDTGNRILPIFSSPFAGVFPLTNYFDHNLPVGTFPAKGYELNFCDERAAGRLEPHRGYDWVMPVGTPLLAVADGQVTYAGTDPPFYCAALGRVVSDQRFVEILHPAASGELFSSVFVHLSRIDVGVGQVVSRGQTVGLSGDSGCSTEPHLHLHVWRFTHTNNGFPTVVDPYGWEGAGPDPWSLVSSGSSSVWLWGAGQAPALRPR